MDYIIPISEARARLPELVRKISQIGKHFIITRNGRPEAVILSPEELESLEIKADRKLMQSLIRAEEDIRAGRIYSHKELFKDV